MSGPAHGVAFVIGHETVTFGGRGGDAVRGDEHAHVVGQLRAGR